MNDQESHEFQKGARWMAQQVFALHEETIEQYHEANSDYARGRRTEAKSIAKAIGAILPSAATQAVDSSVEHVINQHDWSGAAFPCEGGDSSGLNPDPGMSLRDFFAAESLRSLGTWIPDFLPDGTPVASNARGDLSNPAALRARAAWAYAQADAMLAHRHSQEDDGG